MRERKGKGGGAEVDVTAVASILLLTKACCCAVVEAAVAEVATAKAINTAYVAAGVVAVVGIGTAVVVAIGVGSMASRLEPFALEEPGHFSALVCVLMEINRCSRVCMCLCGACVLCDACSVGLRNEKRSMGRVHAAKKRRES